MWLRVCCGVRIKLHGDFDKLPRPAVIVSNHQSSLETFILQRYFDPLTTILKKELLRIPFFGWGLKSLNPIAIDRSQPAQALKLIRKEGLAHLSACHNVLIFPEGTRKPVGELGDYKRSAADLAKAAKVPIIPIAHNCGENWINKRFIKYPGTVNVFVGAPILLTNTDTKEVMQTIQEWTKKQIHCERF